MQDMMKANGRMEEHMNGRSVGQMSDMEREKIEQSAGSNKTTSTGLGRYDDLLLLRIDGPTGKWRRENMERKQEHLVRGRYVLSACRDYQSLRE